MDFCSELKPMNETKSDEEGSDDFIMNVLPAYNEKDEISGFSAGNYDSESEHIEGKTSEAKLYSKAVSNPIEYFDSEDQEKHNKVNVTNECNMEDKNEGLQLHGNENEEKEVSKVDNDFMQQINPQEDVFSDSSYASSIETDSSGIGNDFKEHEDCAGENECEINDNMFEDSSASHFHDVESSKDNSSKKEGKASENSVFLGKGQGKINFINNEDNVLKDVVSSDNNVSLFDSITFPYKNPANCFDVVVPPYYECNMEDKNEGLQLHGNEIEEKEVSKVDNDFMQQINPQEDVFSDSSYASSIETDSSGIGNDFKEHEDCAGENEGEINDNMFEDSSANQFHEVESSKDNSSKKEIEASENSVFLGKGQGKINFINNEDNVLKDVVSSDNNVSLFDSITFPYKNPANRFDVVVPLIGKNVIAVGDIQPFNHRYDLAREINRLRGIEDAPYLPKLSYHEWRKQRDARPQEEKDREERYEKFLAVKTAAYIIKTSVIILQEMQKDDPDEGIIERCFIRFLRAPVSPLSVLLSSPFVHVMMYIRGSSYFSDRLRYVADKCYSRCHVMFPIPDGYNFETVYTSEVIKNIPDQLKGMHSFLLDYDDYQYPVSESDDSAFSESDDSAFSDDDENEVSE